MTRDEYRRILERTAPGTPLREALDRVVQLGTGGLVVIADREVVAPIIAAGVELNSPFTPQSLAELCKMDRAVVVDEGLKTILYANAHLVPDPNIPSAETGTRHRVAEQTAKQIERPVIAISEERKKITIYYKSWRYELKDPLALSSQASQALLILDRYRRELHELLTELAPMEFERKVPLDHVAMVVQKAVQMIHLEEELKDLFVELGKEGKLLKHQLRGLMRGVRETLKLVVLDFRKAQDRPVEEVIGEILALDPEEVLVPEVILKTLGYSEDELESPVPSRGFRLLSKIPRLPPSIIERLVEELGSLDQIERANRRQLQRIKGIAETRARAIKSGLARLRNRYISGGLER